MSIEDGHEIHQNRFQHSRVISLFFCFIKKIFNETILFGRTQNKVENIGIQKRKRILHKYVWTNKQG
jgi:hypothetical protein